MEAGWCAPREADLLACCASRRWARTVAAGRYDDLAALRAASARALAELDWDDVLEALAAHPRIGDRANGGGDVARWSRGEQSGLDTMTEDVRRALLEGNLAYEKSFGHVFLIRATGRGATEVLAELRARLRNDVETERRVARAELTEIVDLRLAALAAEGGR
ncbi:2-oxo-4-hydroxy-4-carboxy-5-ureidoimidazoline decarboxylase [Actinoallomurus rhizosphaericola]|uniref:2-oxo-4-hydroxy-4-carboxy-5-ureidoimidazoline decarboxylase n=1 Tax=Actinoallomurus rhizosphaericola TaxID=2952536 RepID=UPI002093DFBA|nr:2-oxo-4-hydroxy-4-carboxy-5-ureidoimidazoline decarboxylase [Actinoallomurus rhizosphaericola]MCO5995333.1 2-oxo-4-hydroxy-4-carboxy-5-ureidoimidazoline decarboxylase [Actinoallomurus rhizosphaericola]